MQIDLYLTPVQLGRAASEDRTVVVIDVLRATTSICAALMAGARGVIPVDEPGEAGDIWSKVGSDNAVLAGERNGVKIENFELGNSPAEFTAEAVGGKIVILTTTNGTQAFARASQAKSVVSCALVNVSTVAARLAADNNDLVIVCSGREGNFSIEDTLCGGMLLHLLSAVHKRDLILNDAASLAILLYRSNKTAIKQTIRQGEHGRFLESLGFERDIELSSEIDSIPVLPVLRDGRLVRDDLP
jgi:2-phosphosulfolactate phosphatase